MLASAPTSAIAGIWFFHESTGKLVWQYFGVIAALAAVCKPLLGLTKRIKDMEAVLAGYRILEYDLMEIRVMIEQKRSYDSAAKADLRKAIQREKTLVSRSPELREHTATKRQCEEEVLRELPSTAFFVPPE